MGAIWVGIDDTDSPRGGCTTWTLTELLSEARDQGLDLLGEPRLVRLNPNIPWKTRGNAALCARFGKGRGPRHRVGEIDGEPLWGYSQGESLPVDRSSDFLERAWSRVLSSSRVGEARTDPALVASSARFPASVYYDAVRSVVDATAVEQFLRHRGAWFRSRGDGGGIIGASAAIAWPGRRCTWELIAYRPVAREGERRAIDADSVVEAAHRHGSLFLCHDPRTRRLLVAPHTPCPILFGLRATDRRTPLRARPSVRSEKVDRWVLFRTNQGTGDHLVRRTASELLPFGSARLLGTILAPPHSLPGGHVRLRAVDREGTPFEAIAFEPTKTLPRVAQQLAPGDRVDFWGSRALAPTVKLEGIRVVALAPRWSRAVAPECPDCHRKARSLGAARGYRCSSCRRTFPPEAARRARRASTLVPGTYHPTPSARRHLAPLGPEPA